jgi:hypothetical protein
MQLMRNMDELLLSGMLLASFPSHVKLSAPEKQGMKVEET